jgi:hypothetical protein
MTLKDYKIDDNAIYEWLPYGGIVRPEVVKNKDGSFMGIIEYEKISHYKNLALRSNYRNGWSVWLETQHKGSFDKNYFILCWNPFKTKDGEIKNYTKPLQDASCTELFLAELKDTAKSLSLLTECRILKYQEIVDVLRFSLSLADDECKMPDIPLYLDVVLSKDLDMSFSENGISINGKNVYILSLAGLPKNDELEEILESLKAVRYRYVKRLLFFDKKSAEKNLAQYTSLWCNGRKSVKKLITDKLLNNYNVYFSEIIVLLLTDEESVKITEIIRSKLKKLELLFIIEEYNLKDSWWGSLPAIFRANIAPPVMGFSSLESLLRFEKGGDGFVQAEQVSPQQELP